MSARSQTDPGRTRRVRDLEARITESRHLRRLVRDPDLAAVRLETIRRRTVRGLWCFLTLGLMFTTTGVHDFLAAGATPADPRWWGAWTVEPMLAGLLIVLLNFEATILAYGIDPDSTWWHRLKRVLLASTLFMNVAPQLQPLTGEGAFNLGALVVHALIPVIVYGLAEVLPIIQARAHTAITHAYATADTPTGAELSLGGPAEPVQAPEPAADEGSMPELPPESESESPSPQAPPEPKPETALQPASTPEPEPPSSPASVGSVRLPDAVLSKLRTTRDHVLAEGRVFTAADVQQAVRVSDNLAARIATEFTPTNGHAAT